MDGAVEGTAARKGRAGLAWPPRMTRTLATEAVMWAYGAGMMCWLFAVILTVPDKGGDAALGSLGVVFASWAAGTLPAYMVASLAARRWPAA